MTNTKNKMVISNWDKLPVVLNLHTVALIFDVSEVTIKHWIYDGTIKGSKVGKNWYFDKSYIISLTSSKTLELSPQKGE